MDFHGVECPHELLQPAYAVAPGITDACTSSRPTTRVHPLPTLAPALALCLEAPVHLLSLPHPLAHKHKSKRACSPAPTLVLRAEALLHFLMHTHRRTHTISHIATAAPSHLCPLSLRTQRHICTCSCPPTDVHTHTRARALTTSHAHCHRRALALAHTHTRTHTHTHTYTRTHTCASICASFCSARAVAR